MDKNVKDQDVLLVKEQNSDELKAVKGIDKDGKLQTTPSKQENNPDFLKIDKHGNVLENFFSNFMRQVKNPTHFMFFKAPADKAGETANNLQEALKNSEQPVNKQFLDMHKVEPEQYAKTHAINPDLVQWEKFQNYGITRENLEKSGNLNKLLDYQKTNLMPVAMKFESETLRSDARFSLKKMDDGSFTPSVHLIRKEPELKRPYFGIKFTEEDKQNLLETNGLGRVADAEFTKGEKTPVFLSLDKQTNELVAYRKEWLKLPDTYKGAILSEEQKQKFANGEKVKVEGMTSTKGTKFDGEVQFDANKRYLALVFNQDKKQSQNQNNQQGKTTGVYISNPLLGAPLDEKQYANIKAMKTVYVEGMKKDGREFNAYVKIDAETSKLKFYKQNPDLKQEAKQQQEVKPETKKGRKI
ncbi:hypothetical protein AGMMS49525_12290 [Bacteroidia bacterium]|nr:hypothetical protein AGMMS49525_12290 [Bacteroidia bacterium]